MLLKIAEAAQRLALSPATLRAWIGKGHLPVVRLGRAVRVKADDVDALIRFGYKPSRPHARARRSASHDPRRPL